MMRNCFVSKDIRDHSLVVPEVASEELGGRVANYVTSDMEDGLLHTDEAYESISVKISDFEKKL